MKLRSVLIAVALLAGCAPALAQWQTPNHSVPVGRGAGVTGFGSAVPGTKGLPLVSNSATTDPSFQALLFGNGDPWVDVKSGANGCAAAVGDGTHDDTTAIQCQLDWINSTIGGGVVLVPPGNFLISGGGVHVKGGTFLQGSGRFATTITSHTDSTVVTFDSGTCARGAGMADLFAVGALDVSNTQDVVIVGLNCPVTLSRNYIWGGHHALNTAGADGTYTDNYICGWTGNNVFSTGANWYFSNKLDACGANPTTGNGFEQAATAGIAENYMYRMDISCGTCTNSIKIDDGAGTKAITFFYGVVASKPIVIANAKTTSFIGGELGTFTGAGAINITGAYAFSPMIPAGTAVYSCAGNTNITCDKVAFYFHKNNVAQTGMLTGAYDRVSWSTAKFNVGGGVLAGNKWTAPVAGYYQMDASIWWSANAQSTSTPTFVVKIIKNSAGLCNGADVFAGVGTAQTGAPGQAIAQANGLDLAVVGDVYEVCAFGTSVTPANNLQIDGNPAHVHWSGVLVH